MACECVRVGVSCRDHERTAGFRGCMRRACTVGTSSVNNAARFAGLPPSPFAQAGWEKR